jgi:hypothetical protein
MKFLLPDGETRHQHAPRASLAQSRPWTFAFVLACLMAGCAPAKKEPNVNLAGYPPAFRSGYIDGCNSARHAGSPKKDEARARVEPQYGMGWRDGFDICSRQKN